MDEREAKLPAWARELIADLRNRLKSVSDTFVKELTYLRPQVSILRDKNAALVELLECAAKGGHPASKKIVEMIEVYDLKPTAEES